MRTRSTPDHQDVVARRLELLRAELTGASTDERADEPEDEWWGGHTRVPEPVPEQARPPVDAALAERSSGGAVVPVPGRHAARRSRTVDLAGLVPEPVRGRIGLGPWHLAVVAVLVALGLGVTCWWVVRSDAAPVTTPDPITSTAPLVPLASGGASPVAASASTSPPASAAVPVGTSVGASGASASAGTVTVDVEGKVRRPGIAVLPAGSRIVDAIRSAGGAPHRRDLAGLNLAAVLVDGQQIVVGRSVAAPLPTGSTATGSPSGELVDLNTATAEDLDTLPDVGPVTAQSILEWRAANGGFTSVDELLEVDGIGEATLAKIAPHVTV